LSAASINRSVEVARLSFAFMAVFNASLISWRSIGVSVELELNWKGRTVANFIADGNAGGTL
jgi:hypothetical protein